ncbi:MAG TPA: hypothetical protein VJU15_13260 [Gemmatimonadales bacterium]|nr:hypothetical protein [Gemmatimonadales bacterium]
MEGVLAIILIFGGGAAAILAYSPVGKALSDRIRGGAPHAGPDPEVLNELEALRQDVSELQERLDFTERLLAQSREAGRIGGGPVE